MKRDEQFVAYTLVDFPFKSKENKNIVTTNKFFKILCKSENVIKS